MFLIYVICMHDAVSVNSQNHVNARDFLNPNKRYYGLQVRITYTSVLNADQTANN